jgi:hypothetical protein
VIQPEASLSLPFLLLPCSLILASFPGNRIYQKLSHQKETARGQNYGILNRHSEMSYEATWHHSSCFSEKRLWDQEYFRKKSTCIDFDQSYSTGHRRMGIDEPTELPQSSILSPVS